MAGGGQRCGEMASHGALMPGVLARHVLAVPDWGELGSLPSGAAGRAYSWVCHYLT